MNRSRGRVYRTLLRLFPADFRADFGPDLEQLFEDRLREARVRGEGTARLWAAAVGDVRRCARSGTTRRSSGRSAPARHSGLELRARWAWP